MQITANFDVIVRNTFFFKFFWVKNNLIHPLFEI